MWEVISQALASLGSAVMAVDSTPAPDLGNFQSDPQQPGSGEEEGESLIEYEGMLVSASAAQRRRLLLLLTVCSSCVYCV